MKKLFLMLSITALLVGLFGLLLAYRDAPKTHSGVTVEPGAIPSLNSFPSSLAFSLGRYPGVIDANQSEPIIAPVSGYFSFKKGAFAKVVSDGTILGVFESQLKMKTEERSFLADEYERLKTRIDLMGDLERERRLRGMVEKIATARENLRILEAVEKNPDLESTLFTAADFGISGGDVTLDSAKVTLQLLEAEYALMKDDDGDLSSQKRSFEIESSLSSLDSLIRSLSAEMPFNGTFTPSFPEDVIGRTVPVQMGDVIGLASDNSSIYLEIISTDPELALVENARLSARVRVGGKNVEGEFVGRELVAVQDRPVPLYRFRLPTGMEGMSELIGSQVSCEILQNCEESVISVPKLTLVQSALKQGIEPTNNWSALAQALYPEATFFAETKASLILRH